tara:strand:- start:262 stop:492 length:231 start_codon:yes stop_codon:yes gene_type:complete
MEVLMSTTKFPPPVFIKKVIADVIYTYNSDLLRQVELNQITIDQCHTQKFPTNAIKHMERAVNIAVETWELQQNAD